MEMKTSSVHPSSIDWDFVWQDYQEIKIMKLRAIIKKTDDWWIGWLVDIPEFNVQERTREELLESLRIGAEDILSAEVEPLPGTQIEMIDVPLPS